MNAKTYHALRQTFAWCRANPGKTAMVVNPEGQFTITFQPRTRPEELSGLDASVAPAADLPESPKRDAALDRWRRS